MFQRNERIKCIEGNNFDNLQKGKIYTVDYVTGGYTPIEGSYQFCYTKEIFGWGFRVDRFKKLSWLDKIKENNNIKLWELIPSFVCFVIGIIAYYWFML